MLLIDDRIHGDRGLARRAVADNELALTASHREQRVDNESSGLHRFTDESTVDDSRRGALDRVIVLGRHRLFAINWAAERIDDAAKQPGPNRDAHHFTCSGDARSRLDGFTIVEEHRGDSIGIEGEREAHPPSIESKKFVEAGLRQPRYESNPIADPFDDAESLGLRGKLGPGDGLPAAREPVARGVS